MPVFIVIYFSQSGKVRIIFFQPDIRIHRPLQAKPHQGQQ